MSDIAQLGYLAVAKQAAKGTPVAPTMGMKATSISLGGETEMLTPDAEIGGGRFADAGAAALGLFSVKGDVEAYLRHETFPLFLLGAGFSAPAPTQEATTGAYKHVFTPGADPKYLTVETSWGANRAMRRASDVLVDSIELEVKQGDYATCKVGLIGANEAWQATPIVPTYETAPVATYLGSAVTLDGLGTYRFTEMSVKLANNLSDDEGQIGSRSLADVTAGAFELTVEGTIRLGTNAPASLTDLYRAAVYGSKTATSPQGADPYHTAGSLTFGSPRKIGTSPSSTFRHELVIPDLVLDGLPLEGKGDDILEVKLSATAFANGSAPVVTWNVYNSRSTVY